MINHQFLILFMALLYQHYIDSTISVFVPRLQGHTQLLISTGALDFRCYWNNQRHRRNGQQPAMDTPNYTYNYLQYMYIYTYKCIHAILYISLILQSLELV